MLHHDSPLLPASLIALSVLALGPCPGETAPPPAGTLEIVSVPTGATVTVDRMPKGTTPLTLDKLVLGPDHSVKVAISLPGYHMWRRRIDGLRNTAQRLVVYLQPGADDVAPVDSSPDLAVAQPLRSPDKAPLRPLELDKEAAPTAADAATGTASARLAINTIPPAQVWVDDRDTGRRTPIFPGTDLHLSPGVHDLRFVTRDGGTHLYRVWLRSDQLNKLIIPRLGGAARGNVRAESLGGAR